MSDLQSRAATLVALVLVLFVPICVHAGWCELVLRGMTACACVEWIAAARSAPASSRRRLALILVALPAWAAPTLWLIPSFLRAGEPLGHARCMELLVIVMIVSDSAQLLVGRAFGRTRIVPSISPNKTLEGYAGGLVATLAYGGAVHGWSYDRLLVAFAAGVAGDLYFSLAKRQLGVKDFSPALGSHGGISDRIDSYAFALNALWLWG